MTDFRAELQALVTAHDDHGGRWPQHHEDALFNAVERARVALAEQVAEPPAEGEVAELVNMLTGIAYWRRRGRPGEGDPSPFDIRQADRLTRAAELLERLSPVPVPVPVPVAERLPGLEDCDADERCWLLAPRWILPPDELTHWLPAHALPLPAPQGGEVEP